MKLTNTQYDIAKRILVIVVPGLVTAITGLGALYGFSTELIVGTITILATFAGVLLNAASNTYQDEQKPDYGDGQSETEVKKD